MNRLKRLVGRLFMVGVPGSRPDRAFLEELREWGAGGLIFFSRHTADLELLRSDLRTLVEACPEKPLLAVDHEGGPVMRFGCGLSELPSAMAVSAATAEGYDRVESLYSTGAYELNELGFSVNLAPVADINSPENPGIGLRSFSDDPAVVASFVERAVRGFHAGGVLATVKHFPGKGAATVDAHLAMPVVPVEPSVMDTRELLPFRAAVAAGVRMVMSSHVLYPPIDATFPATFSEKIISGILRDRLGFRGVAVTDDLEMGGSLQFAGPAEAALRAIRAGHDLALICHSFEAQRAARRLVLKALLDGELSERRLAASAARVDEAVGFANRLGAAKVLPDPTIADDMAGRSIVCRGARPALLPFRPGSRLLLFVPALGRLGPGVDDRVEAASFLIKGLSDAAGSLVVRRFSLKGEPMAGWDGAMPAGEADLTVFCSLNCHLHAGQLALLRRVARHRRGRFVHVALRNPFDLALTDGDSISRIATFGYRSNVLKALVEVLCGRRGAQGRLPVSLL